MLLDARPYREEKIKELKERVSKLPYNPRLVLIRVGDDPASKKYVNNKIKMCEEVGVISTVEEFPVDVTQEYLEKQIELYNNIGSVTGILVQLPLPEHIDESRILSLISPEKEVDGFCNMNLGKLVRGEEAPIACTPKGIINLLKYYNIEIEGKDVLIINRSNIVGKPLAMLFLRENATPTLAHSKTKSLYSKVAAADIVVTAVGKEEMFDYTDFSPNTTIVDVSINVNKDGKLCGDVCKGDYQELIDMGCNITPVPNGVGVTTVLALIEQVIEMKERQQF